MEPRYDHFDHTADVGVRVYAPTLAGLVQPAAEGFYRIIGELMTAGAGTPREFDLTGDDPALLLRDFLAHLLELFDTEQQRLIDLEVREFSDSRLSVGGRVATIDPSASTFEREVKAITYHELGICRTDDGYLATYIADI